MVDDPGTADPTSSETAIGAQVSDLLDHIPATVYIVTNEILPKMLYVNRQVERLSGYSAKDWRDHPDLWIRCVHPSDRERVAERWAHSIETRTPFAAEYRMIRPDSTQVWVREVTDPILGEGGAVICWQGVTHDITDRQAAQDALSRSEARYRALVERLPAVIYVDSDEVHPRSLYVSPNSEEILGYTPGAYMEDASLWTRAIHPDDLRVVLQAWADAVDRRVPFHAEYRVVHPDGSTIWVRDSSIPILDEDEVTLFWQGMMLDITAQKAAEGELWRSESRYRVLVEQVPAVVYEMGPDDERQTIFVSPHVEEILGYSRQEWLDQPDIWTELLHPDDREIELAAHDLHTQTGEQWRREYRLIASDGRTVWVRDQAVLVHDEISTTSRWQGVMLDITAERQAVQSLRDSHDELEWRVLARTAELEDAAEMMSLEIGERKRVEAELRGAEARYRLLVEDLPAVVYSWETNYEDDETSHPQGHPYMSPQIEDILGYTPKEWMQTHFWKTRLHPHDRDRVLDLAERSTRTGEPFNIEYRYLARDGRVVWVLDRAILQVRDEQGRPRLFQGVLLDVTARKQAETKAAEAEAWFRRLTERHPGITWVVSGRDPDPAVRWHRYYVSPRSLDQLGYPPEAFSAPPEGWFAFLHPDDRDRVIEEALHAWRTGDPWSSDYRMIHADGRVRWFHQEGRAVEMGEDGLPGSYQGMILDINDRKQEEERLREEGARSRELLDGMPGIPWTEMIDPDTGQHRFTHIGPQSLEILGYTPDELMGEPRHFERLVHPEDRDRVMAVADRSDRTGEPWDLVFRVTRRDGEIRWLHGTARLVSAPGDPVQRWQGVTLDVTNQMAPSEPGSVSAPAGTDATPSAAGPSRPAADDSRAAR